MKLYPIEVPVFLRHRLKLSRSIPTWSWLSYFPIPCWWPGGFWQLQSRPKLVWSSWRTLSNLGKTQRESYSFCELFPWLQAMENIERQPPSSPQIISNLVSISGHLQTMQAVRTCYIFKRNEIKIIECITLQPRNISDMLIVCGFKEKIKIKIENHLESSVASDRPADHRCANELCQQCQVQEIRSALHGIKTSSKWGKN